MFSPPVWKLSEYKRLIEGQLPHQNISELKERLNYCEKRKLMNQIDICLSLLFISLFILSNFVFGEESSITTILSALSFIGLIYIVSMVFIDGSHTFESARNDYKCWKDKIKNGGILAIHDVYDSEKEGGQAPKEIYLKSLKEGFKLIKRVKSLVILKKSN